MITRALLGVGVILVLGCAQAPEPAAEAAETAPPAECPMMAMHMAGMPPMPGTMSPETCPCPHCSTAATAETPEAEPAN